MMTLQKIKIKMPVLKAFRSLDFHLVIISTLQIVLEQIVDLKDENSPNKNFQSFRERLSWKRGSRLKPWKNFARWIIDIRADKIKLWNSC